MAPDRSTDRSTKRFSLLLVEPCSIVRSTITSVARSLDIVDIQEAPSIEAAAPLLHAHAFDGLVIALGDDCAGLALIKRIRDGSTASPTTAAVAITTQSVDQDSIAALKRLEVKRVLLKPFKVKTILQTITAFAQTARHNEPS
ncbi:response regulator [Aquabacterium sp.]|uniref:response regulator n=1 Tax=Aquabacterium sp. TaxID=1872578 RepID=UPI00199528FE|nr:response regulator [Aquabacterium sp.]MBC7700905.1 response regulator [Aquabacterium sp.]